MYFPSSIIAGDSIKWAYSLVGYPATEWKVACVLFGASNRHTLESSVNNGEHEFNLKASDTAAWVAGRYDWALYAVNLNDNEQRHTLESGKVLIRPNPDTVTDNRSHAERMVEVIEAVIEGKATKAQLDTLRARHNEREWDSNPELLMKWRKLYQDEVTRQRNLEAMQAGGGINRAARILARF